MTVSVKKSGAGGGQYYTSCMMAIGGSAVDDYYTGIGRGEGTAKEPPGRWFIGLNANGSRETDLGIEDGKIFTTENHDTERFQALVQGWHSDNGSALTQNAGSDKRVAFHDFCLSAPKSVSVLWSQAKPDLKDRIELAQLRSSRVFLDLMSSKSFTRRGKNGVNKVEAPLRAAMFEHGSSREDDPQLHTHCLVFNFCQTPDGKSSALETRSMMPWQGAAASLYHASLAWCH